MKLTLSKEAIMCLFAKNAELAEDAWTLAIQERWCWLGVK
jgi:hypothetical protein